MHGVILLAGQFLLFRVYIMDIPLWIMLASFLHRSIILESVTHTTMKYKYYVL